MTRGYWQPRTRRGKPAIRCQRCGEPKPPRELYQYVDGNNVSVTMYGGVDPESAVVRPPVCRNGEWQ